MEEIEGGTIEEDVPAVSERLECNKMLGEEAGGGGTNGIMVDCVVSWHAEGRICNMVVSKGDGPLLGDRTMQLIVPPWSDSLP